VENGGRQGGEGSGDKKKGGALTRGARAVMERKGGGVSIGKKRQSALFMASLDGSKGGKKEAGCLARKKKRLQGKDQYTGRDGVRPQNHNEGEREKRV